MINRWTTFILIYARIQANSFMYFLSKISLFNNLISSKIYRYKVPKYITGIFGIALDMFKHMIAGNLMVYIAIRLIPEWLNRMARGSMWTDSSISIIIYIIIICFIPAIGQSNIFKPITEDYTFLNHFMINPDIYYRYKIVKNYIMNALLLVPAVIYLFKSGILAISLILIKLGFMASGDAFFLAIYKKRRGIIGVWKRLIIVLFIALFTYVMLLLGYIPAFTIKTILIIAVMIISLIIFITSCIYLFSSKEYKKIAVQFANKDVITLKISATTTLNEDESGIEDSNWEENREYFKINKDKDMWSYLDSVFKKRFKKIIVGLYKQNLFFNIMFGLIIGLLFRFQIINISSSSVMDYSTFVIALVIGMTFGESYLQMCFRYMDVPLLYHHLYSSINIKKCMVKRSLFLMRNGLFFILSLMLGLVILIRIGNISIRPLDFLGLFLVYSLIFAIFELFNIIVYYLLQPYSSDMTIKNPIFIVVSILKGIFSVFVLFVHSNVLLMIKPLIISLIVVIILFLIVLKFSYRTFKLRL